MTFQFSTLTSAMGDERARANEATRAMTTCLGTSAGPPVPPPFCSAGDLLFAAAPMPGRISHGAEHLAQKHKLDIVLGHADAAGGTIQPHRFSLGVRLFWKMLWHHDFNLWQPEGGGVACFVPSVADAQIHFWVEDGGLACDRGVPFFDLRDRARGIQAAGRSLSRLLIEPRDHCRAKAA